MDSLKKTPLNGVHHCLKAKMVDFGGWEMPLNYPPGILAEHLATRKFGGLFDVSHMGRFLISGQDALPFLQYVLTNNAASLMPGHSQYTIIPNENGGAVDDTYLYRFDESGYLLVVNAANLEKDWDWFRNHKSKFPRLVLEDASARIAMLSLQGPRARAVMATVLGESEKLPEPGRNNLTTVKIFGVNVPLARTGYTGEPVCFEMFPPAEIAERLCYRLLEVGEKEGIAPIGLGARDTLRLEGGLPLYGHELGTDNEGKEIPILGLPIARFAVSFGEIKGDYIGRAALAKQFQEIKLRKEGLLDTPAELLLVPRVIMPVAIPSGNIARAGYPVHVGEKMVGTVTSGTMVPYWKMVGNGAQAKPGTESGRRAICLAYVNADLKEGQRIKITIRDKVTDGIIVQRHMGSEAPPYARPLLVGE